MKDLGNLMKQAQGLQAKMTEAQARVAAATVEGVAGAGLVRLVLSGEGHLKSLTLSEDLMAPGEAETAADLVLAAHADAKAKLDALQKDIMTEAMGPLAGLAGGIPGLPKF